MSSVSRLIRRKSTLFLVNRSVHKCRKFYTSDPSNNTKKHQTKPQILGWRTIIGCTIVASGAGTFYFQQKPNKPVNGMDTYEMSILDQWDYRKECATIFAKYLHLHPNGLDKKYTYKVLDVGCGYGLIAQNIKNLLRDYDKHELSAANFEFIGIDTSRKSLEIAENKNIYSKLIETDIAEIPYKFETNEFDFIICCGPLPYIRDREITMRMFREWIRISKQNAILVMTQSTQYLKEDGFIYFKDKRIKWKCVDHIKKQPKYLPNNPYYKEDDYVDYFVAQNLK